MPSGFTLTRSLQAPPGRVWEILGRPGVSIGSDVHIQVEHPGAADGTGMIRLVKVGRSTIREEIISVGPGQRLRYRMLGGAPVREYISGVTLAESPSGGTRVRWDVSFRPRLPGSGKLISLASKRTLNRVLDAVDEVSRQADR